MVRAFIVHGYGDRRHSRILLAGRLEDGRSFAAAVPVRSPSILVGEVEVDRVLGLAGFPPCSREGSPLEPFDSSGPLVLLRFSSLDERERAAAAIRAAGMRSPDADLKPADALLLELGIRGPVEIEGESRKGRNVDCVFPEAVLRPASADFRVPLRLSSIDIETDEKTRVIRAVSIATTEEGEAVRGIVRVLSQDAAASVGRGTGSARGGERAAVADIDLYFHADEAALLSAFASDLVAADCDVLTGWNILDFDLPRLSERFAACGVPFAVARSSEEARYLSGEGRRSAAVFVSGRQVFDALRALRAGPVRYEDHSLETVARAVLGEGKLVSSSGEDKLVELERLYSEDPVTFGAYCLRDAELVLRILDKTGLFRLAVERAALTGVSIDKAWTSVASFERVYAAGLRERGIASAPAANGRRVSGAAGGTVLDPVGGLFRDVAVFDFRSLYPTIMLTFNIDPYAYETAARGGVQDPIVAPNGAAFDRKPGVLSVLIGEYFAARKRALAAGDENAAHVYKILMNSFYGVLGTPTCRYARTELAGAITSTARKWLRFSRDRFLERGVRVLYGDTDSLFVELAPLLDTLGAEGQVSVADFRSLGEELAAAVNAALSEAIRREYGLESRLELRFEKLYRRFLIPPLRSPSVASASPSAFAGDGRADGTARGRAKGYAGLLLRADGGEEVEVKGMEAVRSDSTPLARRLQMELLERIFHDAAEAELFAYLHAEARRLESGALDGELVYRRRLVRSPESYTASTPPQVKAARALGWKERRGVVEYVWTASGAEPVSAQTSPIDRRHYLAAQLLPFAESLFIAAGWDAARLRSTLLGSAEGQMELGL